MVFPAAGAAALAVVAVAVAAYLRSPSGNGASSLAQAIDALPKSSSLTLLEAERQQLIVMDTAAKTLTVAAKPKMVSPSQVMASESAAANSTQAANSGASSSSTSTGGGATAAAPAPGTAQSIAYNMLPSFGFNQSSQYECLVSLWNQESGWNYDAENASGAYGIPQALPASKMASAGPDYLTDPTTQIRWGLQYISQVYGTPCDAEDHEVADGWY